MKEERRGPGRQLAAVGGPRRGHRAGRPAGHVPAGVGCVRWSAVGLLVGVLVPGRLPFPLSPITLLAGEVLGVSIRLLPTCKSCLPFLLLDVSHHLSLSAQHQRQQKSIITRRNCEDLPLASPLASRTPSPLPVVSTPSLCASTNPPDSRGSRPRDFPVPLNPPLPGNLQNSTTTGPPSLPPPLPFERAHSFLCTAPISTSAAGVLPPPAHTPSRATTRVL